MQSSPSPNPQQARLTLAPTVSASSSFLFPSLFSFPPFFTRQPNPQTWAHQLDQWQALVLAHARFTRTFRLEASDAQCQVEPFRNPSLNRQLPLPVLHQVLDALVASGNAAWDPATVPSKGKRGGAVWLYWRRPEEWASVIYDWVKETGQAGTVMTFYELTDGGDLAHSTEFYRLPDAILRKALDVLARQGKAQVLQGVGEQGDGVKFVGG
ncbi:hypothetical protein JCM3770_007254 [Rhodotorula araucariae]